MTDSKKNDTLNPQLKEIYERVMSTKVSSAPTIPATAPQKQAPAPAPQQAPQQRPPTLTSVAINPSPIRATKKTSASKASGGNFSSMLLIIAGVIFFLAYALFWIKFFNVALPFNLPF